MKLIKSLKATIIVAIVALASLNLAYAGKTQKITLQDVENAQQQWAQGIVKIGQTFAENGDYKQEASKLIKKLYAYNYGKNMVLFKPTKALEQQFRKNHNAALSYFVGYQNVKNASYKEDKGFAITPWTKVTFHNDQVYIHNDIAIAMGVYDFTNTKGQVTQVEYTFGYIKTPDGKLKIVLHHSSLPYSGK
ncbi:MAG: phosphoribosyl-AMP cyclohydrolase [Gammaproteobacteria bacterium]